MPRERPQQVGLPAPWPAHGDHVRVELGSNDGTSWRISDRFPLGSGFALPAGDG